MSKPTWVESDLREFSDDGVSGVLEFVICTKIGSVVNGDLIVTRDGRDMDNPNRQPYVIFHVCTFMKQYHWVVADQNLQKYCYCDRDTVYGERFDNERYTKNWQDNRNPLIELGPKDRGLFTEALVQLFNH